jgi:hypothetical protein
MSSLQQSPARVRTARTAAAAVERARLALVPTRSVSAPRAPFAVLVFLLLGAGVVGLLMFNTHMQQGSFYATRLQDKADRLQARSQALDMQLDQLRDPQHLADAGRKLGMVAPAVPALLNLSTGRILGVPTVTLPGDAMRVTPLPAGLPKSLKPTPIIHRVQAPTVPANTPANTPGNTPGKTAAGNSGQTQGAHGTASTPTGTTTDRKGAAATSQGVSR